MFIVLFFIFSLVGWLLGFDQAVLRIAVDSPFITAIVLSSALAFLFSLAGRMSAPWIGFIFLLAIVGVVSYPIRMANWAQGYEHALSHRTSAPDTNFLPRRVLPIEVADQFARGAQTDAQYVYGDLQPTLATSPLNKGRLVWQAASQPNSFVGHFTSGLSSIVEVDADTTKRNTTVYPMNLPRGGEGNFNDFALIIHRTIDPIAQVLAPVYDVSRHEAIVPLVHLVWGIPSFHGLVVFDATGTITRLTLAQGVKRYPTLRLYPEELVNWQASKWGAWRSGVSGHFTKKNVLELADIGGNPPPTLLDDTNRATWVVPMEPQGKSYGLAGLLFVDPATGHGTFWNTASQNVISPSQAISIAEGDARVAQLKNSVALEPKLAIIHGQINWLVPIAPANQSQIQSLALVNAHDRSMTVAPTFAQVFAPPTQDAKGLVTGRATPTLSDRLALVSNMM